MPFQSTVNAQLPYAVEGDFASANPWASLVAGPGQLAASAAGVTIGKLAWARVDTGAVSNAHPGVPARLGFVGRHQPALITAWLGEASMLIPSGMPVTLYDFGDFWGRFSVAPTVGQTVYGSYADGSLSSGTAVTTGTVTGSIASTVLTVTVAGSNILAAGQPISGASVTAGSYIVNQLTGTPGGVGTYTVSVASTAASTTITATTTFATPFTVAVAGLAGELSSFG